MDRHTQVNRPLCCNGNQGCSDPCGTLCDDDIFLCFVDSYIGVMGRGF